MPEQRDLSEAMKEFVATLMTYLKQRGAEFVTATVVDPVRKLAVKLGFGCAGLTLVILGLVFLGICLVQYFGWLFGNMIYGYLSAGVLMLLLAGVLLWLMGRSGKEEAKKRGRDKRADGDS